MIADIILVIIFAVLLAGGVAFGIQIFRSFRRRGSK